MMTNRFVWFSMLVGLLWSFGNGIQAADPAMRTVTDMAGRAVRLPEQISRVVTLGSLPVLNSFVFTMGEARTIVNGLADFGPSS